MLRAISAVLHERRGPTVTDEALDLRPMEVSVLVPLVGCLLALSAWPAAVSSHAFARGHGRQQVQQQFRSALAACAPVTDATVMNARTKAQLVKVTRSGCR
jgi:hypothetical protein